MNLNVKITFGGSVKINKYYVTNEEKLINFDNLTIDMSIEENTEGITAKEYIQAIGSALKDVVAGAVAKKASSKNKSFDELAQYQQQYDYPSPFIHPQPGTLRGYGFPK